MLTGARARKQKYISIYISLHMKTFLKTGVYIQETPKYLERNIIKVNKEKQKKGKNINS